MPILATGPTEATRRRGFTLVEMLVVVIIAGVLTGLVLLRLPATGVDLDRELRRLEAALDFMCDEALLTGNTRAARLTPDGYDFWLRQGVGGSARWRPSPRPGARSWPDGVGATIEIARINLGRVSDASPQVLCSGLEPPTPLRVELRAGDRRAELTWPP
ncbi:MAG: type II secretion system protein [Wenzhouxiangellaceae bacterium]